MSTDRAEPPLSECRPRQFLGVVVFGVVLVGLFPGTVRAHEVGRTEFTAPIPLWLLLAGSGATVALTAAWLAAGGSDRLPRASETHLVVVPPRFWSLARTAAALLFAGVVATAVVAGVVGRQVPHENLATVVTWAVWLHGLALLSVVVGSPWLVVSPWRLLYRGLVGLEGQRIALLGAPPAGIAAWPALGGFLLLVGLVENLTVVPRSPRLTAAVVAGYGIAMLAGAVLFGPAWFERADPLERFYGLLGRVSPVSLSTDDDPTVSVRLPWQGSLRPVSSVSVVAFVVATVYTVSFDGFTETRTFQSILFAVRDGLGTGVGTGFLLYLGGFCGFVGTFLVACWGCERLGTGPTRAWRPPARRFAPTVVPIAAAYEVAHNYPFVLRGTGRALALVARPLFPRVEPFDPLWWLSLSGFWASQVALVVLGHLIAVVAAHHVAADRYGSRARRGHLLMVAVMVGYTVLSLWIISRPVVA